MNYFFNNLFKCQICDSKYFYSSNIQQHLNTQKHQRKIQEAKEILYLHDLYAKFKCVNHKDIIQSQIIYSKKRGRKPKIKPNEQLVEFLDTKVSMNFSE